MVFLLQWSPVRIILLNFDATKQARPEQTKIDWSFCEIMSKADNTPEREKHQRHRLHSPLPFAKMY